MASHVAIVGLGRFGQTVYRMLSAAGVPLRLWARRTGLAADLAAGTPHVTACNSIAAACGDAEVIVLAVPIGAWRVVVQEIGAVARGDHVVLHGTRGVAPGFVLPHAVLRAETCVRKIGALGGPLYAPSIATPRPVAAVLASRFDDVLALARQLTANTMLRLHPSRDVVGVEVAGAIADVVLLAVGMAQGLDMGETVRGLLLTRGLADAAAITRSLGGDPMTLVGLAGIGDLVPRQVEVVSRHLEVGRALAGGASVAAALAAVHGSVDGVQTAQAVATLAAARHLDVPLLAAVARVLAGLAPVQASLEQVLSLDFNPTARLTG